MIKIYWSPYIHLSAFLFKQPIALTPILCSLYPSKHKPNWYQNWKIPIQHIIFVQSMIFQTEEYSQSFKKSDGFSPIEGLADKSKHGRLGCWQQNQIFKLVSYLIYNRQSLKLKLQRRRSKVFKQMAKFIVTRNPIQCRSQNQRLYRKHQNFRSIVSSFKSKYGKQRFQKDYESVITNPEIKFKTDFEYQVDQRMANSKDIASQTGPNLPENQFYYCIQPQFPNCFMQNTSSFWMVLPFNI